MKQYWLKRRMIRIEDTFSFLLLPVLTISNKSSEHTHRQKVNTIRALKLNGRLVRTQEIFRQKRNAGNFVM